MKDKRQPGRALDQPTRKQKMRKSEKASPVDPGWLEGVLADLQKSSDGGLDFNNMELDMEGLEFEEEDMRGFGGCSNGNAASGDPYHCGGSKNVCQDQSDPDKFKYGFTNSEFICFLATVDPIEFIVIVTVFSIIFNAQFNLEELFVVNRFITSLRDGIDILLNQRINLRLVCDVWRAQQSEDQVQKQLEALQKNYEELHNRLKDVEGASADTDLPAENDFLENEASLKQDIAEDNLFNLI